MATRKYVVTGEHDKAFYSRKFELERQWRAGGQDPDTLLPILQALCEPGSGKEVIIVQKLPLKADWLATILNTERKCHLDFFGREFDLAEFEITLRRYGRKKIKAWQKLGLEPHFLPQASMMSGENYSGWKIKPEDWFYKKQLEGKLFLDSNGSLEKVLTVELKGITVLIDTRLKPSYKDGKQMWEGDSLFGLLIADLRKDGKISRYEHGPQSSRFGVSAAEWQEQVRPALATKLGLDSRRLRLECAIEANVISQLYPHMARKDDGQTNTWVWYEEYFEGRGYRLYGGYSAYGVLALVSARDAGDHWSYRSFRPLAVL